MDGVLSKPVERTALVDLLQRLSARQAIIAVVEPSSAGVQEEGQKSDERSDRDEDAAVHKAKPQQTDYAPLETARPSSALGLCQLWILLGSALSPSSFPRRSRSASKEAAAAVANGGTVPHAPVVFDYLPLLELFGYGMEKHIRASIQKFHEQGTKHLLDPVIEHSGSGNLQLLCSSTHLLRGKASYVGGTTLKSAGVL